MTSEHDIACEAMIYLAWFLCVVIFVGCYVVHQVRVVALQRIQKTRQKLLLKHNGIEVLDALDTVEDLFA